MNSIEQLPPILPHSALLLPTVCGGMLLTGVLYFIYVYVRSKDPLYLSMWLFALAGMFFVFAESAVLYTGGMLFEQAAARQLFRFEQTVGAFFIVLLPYFLGNFLRLEGREKRLNARILLGGFALTAALVSAAFLRPDLYVSITKPHSRWLEFAGDYGRGQTGPLYLARDAALAVVVLYCFVMIARELRRGKKVPSLHPMLLGLAVAVFQSADDIYFVHTLRHFGPFPEVEYSRFALGLTFLIILSMGSLTKRFIDEANRTKRARHELERSRRELLFLAYHDPLTGLRNRKAFMERIEEALADAERSREKIQGLIVFDCEGYKDLNDRLGHEIGDWLIAEVAARLKKLKRKADLLFRTDSDEFAVLLTSVKNETDCAIVAEKICGTVRRPFVFGTHTLFLVPHAGIAVYPKDAADAPSLIRNAGSALVEAKSEGNDFQFYTASLHLKATERINLLHSLRRALEQDEFELHYQPQIGRDGTVVGAEALIRWKHPEIGYISPIKFIPLAEETGLIIPLGRWVIFQACSQMKNWKNVEMCLPVSVNLSTQQLKDKNLLDVFDQAVSKNGIDPEHLHIEITESSLMENLERNLKILNSLRAKGFRFSIDDFGTGYSSLSYLKKLPIEAVKIDRSFVIGLPTDRQDCALVKAITAMAKGLSLEVVAEGVDKQEQLDFLHGVDCRIIQGYLFSKPLIPEDYFDFVRNSPPKKYPLTGLSD